MSPGAECPEGRTLVPPPTSGRRRGVSSFEIRGTGRGQELRMKLAPGELTWFFQLALPGDIAAAADSTVAIAESAHPEVWKHRVPCSFRGAHRMTSGLEEKNLLSRMTACGVVPPAALAVLLRTRCGPMARGYSLTSPNGSPVPHAVRQSVWKQLLAASPMCRSSPSGSADVWYGLVPLGVCDSEREARERFLDWREGKQTRDLAACVGWSV